MLPTLSILEQTVLTSAMSDFLSPQLYGYKRMKTLIAMSLIIVATSAHSDGFSNPFNEGYIQRDNPFNAGYVQYKSVFGFEPENGRGYQWK